MNGKVWKKKMLESALTPRSFVMALHKKRKIACHWGN
jgi:hypothetical protein